MSSDIKAYVSLTKHTPIHWNSCNDDYLLSCTEPRREYYTTLLACTQVQVLPNHLLLLCRGWE